MLVDSNMFGCYAGYEGDDSDADDDAVASASATANGPSTRFPPVLQTVLLDFWLILRQELDKVHVFFQTRFVDFYCVILYRRYSCCATSVIRQLTSHKHSSTYYVAFSLHDAVFLLTKRHSIILIWLSFPGPGMYSGEIITYYTGWSKKNGATLHFPKYLENY